MAVLKFLKKPAEEVLKKGLDKIFRRTIEGAKGSPFKNVDDLGAFPIARNPRDLPGSEIKKLKAIGEKIRKGKKLKRLKDDVEMNMGGRVKLRGGGICKRGMNRQAIGKNS